MNSENILIRSAEINLIKYYSSAGLMLTFAWNFCSASASFAWQVQLRRAAVTFLFGGTFLAGWVLISGSTDVIASSFSSCERWECCVKMQKKKEQYMITSMIVLNKQFEPWVQTNSKTQLKKNHFIFSLPLREIFVQHWRLAFCWSKCLELL